MTDTLISLISIIIGIIGANLTGYVFKKYSFGSIGNTIAGVFGSIFLIKSFGRFGFDPMLIMKSGNVDVELFTLNALVSFFGGAIAVISIKMLRDKMTKQVHEIK